MIHLHLVRHGPTHARGMAGWSDIPADLSDTAALARLAAHLPAEALVVSSDLSRATATADAIAGGRTRLPHEPSLREMNFGEWELVTHADLEAADPARARAFRERPAEVRPPGGETWGEMRARVAAAVDTLAAAHPGRELVLVAHFGVILGLVQRATGLDDTGIFAQRIDNLSVTELRWTGEAWTPGRINHRP